MAGWTDSVFRGICKSFGAGLTCTEMISATGLAYGDPKTHEYLELDPAEDVAVVQLFGNDPSEMAEQAVRVAERLGRRLAAIDINMGCPARKVVRKGEGAALMDDLALASRIISATAASAGRLGVPVTVKFRRGFRAGVDNAVEFARMAEASGAAAICVHGRFASDLYRGRADWGVVARVVDAVEIPVAASGDLMDPVSIARCLALTGADAAMVARGAQGNPWIFPRTATYLEALHESGAWNAYIDEEGERWRRDVDAGTDPAVSTSETPTLWSEVDVPSEPDVFERIRVARLHTRLLTGRDRHHVVKMRSYLSEYLRGMPGASAARRSAMECRSHEDFDSLFDELEAREAMNNRLRQDPAPSAPMRAKAKRVQ